MTNKKNRIIYAFIILCSFFSFSKGISASNISYTYKNQLSLLNLNFNADESSKIRTQNLKKSNTTEQETYKVNMNKLERKPTINIEGGQNCEYLFGDQEDANYPAYWIQWSLNLMKYIAIIALLVLSTMDFLKAMVNQDKDAIQKATITTAKRFIFAVLIFFLPIIVEFIMNLFGAYGTCGLG